MPASNYQPSGFTKGPPVGSGSTNLRSEFNNKSSFDIYNFGNVGSKPANNNMSFSGSNSSMGLVVPTFGQQKQGMGYSNNNNDLYNFNNVGLPPKKNM